MCKRANFWGRKNLPFPRALKHCSREALLAASVKFLVCVAAKADNRSYKHIDLDAAAFGWAAAAKSRSKAAHALRLARSERPSERQRRPCPSKAD